jgi:methionine-rich copper-binding protein CopC
MTDRSIHPSRSRISTALFFATVAISLAAVSAGARSLHLRLVRAEPAVDTTTSVAPKALKLFFSENVKTAVTGVRLTGPDNAVVALDSLRLGDGKVPPVIAPIKGQLKLGKHKVAWRTVGADGHALNGEYSFTLKAAPPDREYPR